MLAGLVVPVVRAQENQRIGGVGVAEGAADDLRGLDAAVPLAPPRQDLRPREVRAEEVLELEPVALPVARPVPGRDAVADAEVAVRVVSRDRKGEAEPVFDVGVRFLDPAEARALLAPPRA